MKPTIATILTTFFASLAGFLALWWTIAPAAFIVALAMRLKPGISFLAGFAGIVIYWLPNILYRDISNNHILSTRLATLFPGHNYIVFIALCTVIGGLLGGLSALSGSLIVWVPRKRRRY